MCTPCLQAASAPAPSSTPAFAFGASSAPSTSAPASFAFGAPASGPAPSFAAFGQQQQQQQQQQEPAPFAFGASPAPSAFGAAPSSAPAFGQGFGAAPSSAPVFGQGFGQPEQQPAFGQGFGQPAAQPAFGQGFGQPAAQQPQQPQPSFAFGGQQPAPAFGEQCTGPAFSRCWPPPLAGARAPRAHGPKHTPNPLLPTRSLPAAGAPQPGGFGAQPGSGNGFAFGAAQPAAAAPGGVNPFGGGMSLGAGGSTSQSDGRRKLKAKRAARK